MTDLQQELAELLKNREFEKAAAICRSRLEENEEDFDTLLAFAATDFGRGMYDQCASTMARCIELRPGVPKLHYNLALAHDAQGRYEEAMSEFDKTIDLDPNFLPAIGAKAATAEKRGDYDLVEATLSPIILSGMEDARTALVWARMKHHTNEYAEAIAIAERHVVAPNLMVPTRRELYFQIGLARERIGEFDKAFDAYRKGNSIGMVAFDPTEYEKHIDRLIEFYSSQRLAELPRATAPSDRPVFLIGMARSGSTLIEQIIHAHPKTVAVGETYAMLNVISGLSGVIGSDAQYPDCLDQLTSETADHIGQSYLDQVIPYGPDALRIIDKLLLNTEHLGLIQLVLPEARIIDCRRAPLDNCVACYCAPLSPENFPYAGDLRNLGLAYRQYERLMRHWHEVLALPIMEVEYEDMVAEPERMSRAIIDFCGLEWDESCLRFYEADRHITTLSYAQVRRPIYKSSLSRHERFDNHLGALKEALE